MKVNLLTQKYRLTSYLILMVCCIVLPYIITIGFVILTQDRITGMKLGLFIGMVTPHLIYGFLFLKLNDLKKVIYTVLISSLIYGLNLFLIKNELILNTSWDLYGYWDTVVLNFLSGIFVWEIFQQLSKKLKRIS
jgi:hypothetical protein